MATIPKGTNLTLRGREIIMAFPSPSEAEAFYDGVRALAEPTVETPAPPSRVVAFLRKVAKRGRA